MPSELHIVGAGGHASVVADAAICSGNWDTLCVYDDVEPDHLPSTANYGGVIDVLLNRPRSLEVVVAIGNSGIRLMLCKQLLKKGMQLANVIHPHSVIAEEVQLGLGTVVFAGAILNPSVKCGIACIFNTGSIVDHHCQLDDAVHVCPGTTLAGRVSVGESSWVGVGATVRDGISIGANTVIGAGAVVVNSIPDNVTAVGCPARLR